MIDKRVLDGIEIDPERDALLAMARFGGLSATASTVEELPFASHPRTSPSWVSVSGSRYLA